MKKLYQLIIGTLMMSAGVTLSAQTTINVGQAGTLETLITDDMKEEMESLKVTGEINGTDLKLIRWLTGVDYLWDETIGKVTHIDLSEAVMVEGGEPFLAANGSQFLDEPIWINARQDALPEQLFSGSNLQKVVLPKSIKRIYSTFSDANSLSGTIVVPEGIEVVGEWAFSATAIEEVILPSTLCIPAGSETQWFNNKPIGSHAFDGCHALKKINIPESVTLLADATFKGCSSLQSLTLPSSLAKIGSETFYGCSSLTQFVVLSTIPPKAEYRAFDGLDLSNVTLYVPEEAINTYKISEGWSEFKDIRAMEKMTGIPATAAQNRESDRIHNLQGIEINRKTLTPGIYIVNGKKIFVK